MADDENGEVECYIAPDDPRWASVQSPDYWLTEFKFGKVEIVDRRKQVVLHA